MKAQRISDSYERRLEDFANNILVVCPSCGKKAVVFGSQNQKIDYTSIRLVCSNCGFNRRMENKPFYKLTGSTNPVLGRVLIYGEAIDPYFHIPLWLTIGMDGHEIWAYNYEHLEFLEKIVEAKLRERNIDDKQNRSLGSRLPRWMTSKKNREAVTKAIHNLKSRN